MVELNSDHAVVIIVQIRTAGDLFVKFSGIIDAIDKLSSWISGVWIKSPSNLNTFYHPSVNIGNIIVSRSCW